jgi:hypothetical protein
VAVWQWRGEKLELTGEEIERLFDAVPGIDRVP